MPSNDRRIRANIGVQVTIICGALKIENAHTVNISLSGMLVQTEKNLPLLSTCKIIVTLNSTQKIEFEVHGEVVRKTDEGVAINFSEMNLEALDHLKKIVIYNAANPSEVITQNLKKPGFKM